VLDGVRVWVIMGSGWWLFFFSSRRRHTRLVSDWSSDVCSSDLSRGVIIGHAAVAEADHVGRGHRLVLIDDQPRAVSELHAERQRDTQKLLVRALRLNEHCGGNRLARLDARILAGETDFLGVGLRGLSRRTLETEFGPG